MRDRELKEYRGSCHCGLLQLVYRTAVAPADWPLRHDGCSFCRKHGVVATSDPAGEVSLALAGGGQTRRYRFGTRTADFLICGECGVFVAAITGTADGLRAVINARVLSDVTLDFGNVVAASLDAESAQERQARRSRNWTPVAPDAPGSVRQSQQ
jgi:hypothetical protein